MNNRYRNGQGRRRLSRSIQISFILLFILCTFFLFRAGTVGAGLAPARPYIPLDFTRGVHTQDAQAHNANIPGKLPSHVPALIKRSHLLGPTNPNTLLTLLVGLYPRNQSDLETFVQSAGRDKPLPLHFDRQAQGTTFVAGYYLTSEQFIATYSPLQTSQDAVIAFMQHAGFKLTQTYKHRLLIGFQGTVRLAEKTFHVQINNYRSPDKRQFYAPTTDPTLPPSLTPIVQSIAGLDNAAHFTHSPLRPATHTRAYGTRQQPHNSNCGSNSSGYIPGQIATAYNLNGLYSAGLQGEGQTVALFELDDYQDNDIATYTSCYGKSSALINRIPVDGGTGNPPGAGAIEVELDMELVLSAAPHLASLEVYEATNSSSGVLDEWSKIISDNTASVISTSWGMCEALATSSFATMENNIFLTAAAQGQTIFAASGDTGSNDCQMQQLPTSPSVDDPASQPYVTGIGGTSLTLNKDNTINSETAWNNHNGNATGGGVSSLWLMPSWQLGPGVINPTYSSSSPCAAQTGNTGKYCREVPDVSLDADPFTGYLMYCTVVTSGSNGPCDPNQPWFPIGGTSAAAPMWAAMTILANEKLSQDTNAYLTRLGFLNPFLYQIGQNASGTSYSNDLHDVTSGDNYTTGDGNGEYPATIDYDMTTGWGSYNAFSLANDLEKLVVATNPPPSPTPSVTPSATISPTASPTLTPSPSPSPTATTTPTAGGIPVSTTWYFAEGKVGAGFTEYITIENPDRYNICNVNITYLLGNGAQNITQPITVPVIINVAARYTESVNSDLSSFGLLPNPGSSVEVSTIVKVNPNDTNCKGVIAERPMYFVNFDGVSSGSDVVGATHTGTSFYFADMPTIAGYNTFITILNPPDNTASATITATYYHGGISVGQQTTNVAPGTRGTLIPTHFTTHVNAFITSTQPVVIERPSYFYNMPEGNAGTVSGAASVIGAQNPATEWLFAEGYTGGSFQEELVLANFDPTVDATATLTLEYQNGHTQTLSIPVNHQDIAAYDINALNAHPFGTCDTTPCQVSPNVSIDISSSSSIVAEREMFFQYNNGHGLTAMGGTDVTGFVPPAASAYAFAEGYTNRGYNEWLTLQNPTNATENISVTLVNAYGHSVMQTYSVVAKSRYTVDITSLVTSTIAPPGSPFQAHEVSMTVQSSNGLFVAERPMYWNTGTGGTQGGSDVFGYSGD